jgi:hypothetical protein
MPAHPSSQARGNILNPLSPGGRDRVRGNKIKNQKLKVKKQNDR